MCFCSSMPLPSSFLSTWNVLQLSVMSENAYSSFRTKVNFHLSQEPHFQVDCTLLPLLCPSATHRLTKFTSLSQNTRAISYFSWQHLYSFARVRQRKGTQNMIRKQTEKTLGYHVTSIRLANIRKLQTRVGVHMNKQEVSTKPKFFGITTLKSNFFFCSKAEDVHH